MKLDLNEVEADQELAKAAPATASLSALAQLARNQLDLEQEIEELENQATAKKEELKKISELDIPQMFSAIGIDEFKLNNGLKVKVKPWYSGKADGDEAFNWLEKYNHSDIIKGEFVVMYRRPDKDKLEAFVKLAEQLGFSVKDKLAVHPMTMKSFIKEQIENGVENFPRELFNVITGFKTSIGK